MAVVIIVSKVPMSPTPSGPSRAARNFVRSKPTTMVTTRALPSNVADFRIPR
jgi:hypothetical protein